jgi:two-component system sensor histidine kinase TctE
VTIRVRANAPGSRQAGAVLEVEDDGPGIPTAEHAHVFDRFYRILGTDTEGSGLGLAIVKEIVTHHSAEIIIDDRQRDQGCLFRISFPLSSAH